MLVAPSAPAGPTMAKALNPTLQANKATEEVSKRVLTVAHAVVRANPQLGLRPLFITVGSPQPEIFHKGTGGLEGCQVVVSEGLARRCTTDAQLAAVICHELGKVIAEREGRAAPGHNLADRDLPPDVPIGNDAAGTFGPCDGTRMMELAKWEKDQPRPGHKPPTLSPETVALQYLKQAGYETAAMEQVRPLLRDAEANCALECNWKTAAPSPAKLLPPAPPK
jgi:predicted Zn-dependent protease